MSAFALWNSPARTAWLLIAYIGAAFLVDSFFRGASFCKYVCPIGQFNFVGSLISPTTLKIRSAATCDTCATRDCIRGNERQRGCELELYLPEKRSNADCTLCMDCVKACPHDNIGILPRSMTQDVLASEPTSSLGRLSRRTDVAAVALVLVVAGFANAAAMVGPGVSFLAAAGRRLPWLATTRELCRRGCRDAARCRRGVAGLPGRSRWPSRGGRRSVAVRSRWCRWAWGCGRHICSSIC